MWLEEAWGEGRHIKRTTKIDNNSGIVLTNGVFDILHKGHLELLKFSKIQGTNVVVAIDSDRRVRELKGNDRPINSEEDRRRILESIMYVDEVVIFDSTKELQDLYETLSPEVVVKGSEWTANEVRERDGIPDGIQVRFILLLVNTQPLTLCIRIRIWRHARKLKYLVVGDTILDETIEFGACGLSLEFLLLRLH